MSEVKFARTAQAATRDRLSKWDLIEAIAADATDAGVSILGAESCLAAKAAIEAGGNEYADQTVRNLCLVAKFDYESTEPQRSLWRRYGWTAIQDVAAAGWSQESAEALLDGDRKTRKDIRAALGTRASNAGVTDSFDERCAQWVKRANQLLMDGARLAEEAEATDGLAIGGHAELALLIYQRLTERQLDAEIRSLLESADVQ